MTSLAASIGTDSRASDIRAKIHDDSRVSLTDFARNKEWRAKLAKNGVLELLDRSGRIAWIVSEEDMTQMVDHIAELEEQMERESIATMLAAREDRDNWMSGPDLAEAAVKSLESRREALICAIER